MPIPTVIPGRIPFSIEVCVKAIKIGPRDTANPNPKTKPSMTNGNIIDKVRILSDY